MEWLVLLVPVVGGAVLILLRLLAAQRVGLPPMTPWKLSAAVSQANKLGRHTLSVTVAHWEADRAIGPMAAIGWQVNTPTVNGTTLRRGKRTTLTFTRVPVVPRARYEYLYDRDTWVRRPSLYHE